MSGGGGGAGGGGGSSGFGGGGGGQADDGGACDRLRFDTILASPDPSVISQLSPGDALDLEIRQQGVAALSRSAGGVVAGWIIDRLPQLLRCLQAGNSFEAEVASINGGAVSVRVRPA